MDNELKITTNLKCSSCGADLAFDAGTGKLTCSSCGFSCNLEDNQTEVNQEFEVVEEKTSAGVFAEGEAVEFTCQNCGAKLVTDAHTSATMCAYCDSPVLLSARLSGSLAPKYAIPFAFDGNGAEERFRAWAKKQKVLPSSFLKNPKLSEMQGIYVPFWLYDISGRGDVNAQCTRTTSRRQGEYIVRTTKYFDVYRKVEVEYIKIPADASERMDDEQMDLLEPYDYSNLENFHMGYLSGFSAEKYSYTDKDLFARISSRVAGYVEQFALSTIRGYQTRVVRRKNFSSVQRDAKYVLLPVYVLNYQHGGKEYSFSMNGQTGKVVGNPPISKLKCALIGSGVFVGVFALLTAIMLVL